MSASIEPLSFLQSVAPFSGWDQRWSLALSDLASRAEVWGFSEGDQIRFPDEGPSGQVWVAEGCLVVIDQGALPSYVGVRERLDAPAGTNVRGQTSGWFLKVPEASWQAWLKVWPAIAQAMGFSLPAPLPAGFAKSPLVLEPDEVPRELFRKAPFFLARRAALPGLFFLLFAAFGLLLLERFGSMVPPWALWILPGAGMLITLGLMTLVTWEWSASVLVITDRSIIIRQIDVWSHRSDFEKMALERIREAVFTKQGLLDSLLHLVTLEIEGDSPKGRLLFRGLAQDSRFLTAMESLKTERTRETLGRTVIRQALAEQAGGARAPHLERAADRQESLSVPVRRLSWRVETNGGVWFRRHQWVVWRRSLPWIGWMALITFLGLVAAGFWPQGVWTITVVGLIMALAPAGRIAWEIWDWADDRLSIQGEKIVMVHRRPLWFGEVRQEGDLDRIEQVGVRKENLVALLFDFGTVTVSLGASEPMVFEYAQHPEWVQNEIFHRRSSLFRERETQASRTRLNEVTEILDTWDEAKKSNYFKETP